MKLKYETVDELQEAINSYFESRDGKNEPYTVCGLALHLGFLSRRSVYDYAEGKIKDKPAYKHTVKNALLKIEEYAERNLYGKHVIGAIFSLKNRGWTDKQTVELEGNPDKPVTITRVPATTIKVQDKDADSD